MLLSVGIAINWNGDNMINHSATHVFPIDKKKLLRRCTKFLHMLKSIVNHGRLVSSK